MSEISSFIKHAGRHLKKKEEISAAKSSYKSQLSKIKRMPKSRPMMQALQELDKKVNRLIDAEQQVIRYEFNNSEHENFILKRIEEVDKKISHYLDMMDMRSDRIKELETKIDKTLSLPEKVESIKSELKELSDKESRIEKNEMAISRKMNSVKDMIRERSKLRSERVKELEKKIREKID